ncbi:MAG: hypothetical protein ACYDCU_15650 [Candidatus Acidiferrales bacterium]
MTSEAAKIVRDIESAVQNSEPISAAAVRSWMCVPSIEVQAVLTDLLLEHSRRIDPALSMDEICGAVQSYYKQCLIEDIQGNDNIPNRHIAGYELVRWFASLWRDPAVPREYLVRLKTMLRDLYIENRVPPNDLVTAVLEHLFETAGIQEFFADWKSEPKLAEAFVLAKEWGDEHTADSETR